MLEVGLSHQQNLLESTLQNASVDTAKTAKDRRKHWGPSSNMLRKAPQFEARWPDVMAVMWAFPAETALCGSHARGGAQNGRCFRCGRINSYYDSKTVLARD